LARPSPRWRDSEALRVTGLALFVFFVYALGACRTAYVGDSGDLLTAIAVMGIPHPSGYPLYVLLGKAWGLLFFFLPLPWALSLFSAACAAAACGVVYRIGREQDLPAIPSLFSALLFAFGPSGWGEANVQRVYALNALLLALATLSAFRWRRSGRFASLAAAFFWCGLGAANHLYMAVFGAALALFAVASEPALLRRPLRILACAGAAALGLLPYLYLPLRAKAHPLLSWGDPQTAGGVLRVVLREGFWERRYLQSAGDIGTVFLDYLRSFATETAWVGAAFALVGIALARRRRWPVLLPLLAMAGNFASMASHGSRTDLFIWHRYYIPSYLMIAVLAGWGCQAVLERVPARARALVFLPPLALLLTGFASFDRSRYRIAEDYSGIILRTLPPGSRLIASDDNILFVLMYLNLGEGRRPDVDLILEGIGGARLPPLAFNPDRDPVFLTHHPNWNVEGLVEVPAGLLFRPWRAGRPLPDPLPVPEQLEGEGDPRVPKDYLTQNLIGNFHYMRGVTFEDRDWLSARREFSRAAAAAPDNDVLFYNLGLIFRRNGLYEDSLAAFRRSAELNPREIPSLSRPRASDRVREVEQEAGRMAALEAQLSLSPALSGKSVGTAAYHRTLSALLNDRGLTEAARGHRLRSEEVSGSP
jgi:tetratricopeptide (TPR) repeat protein